jgi:outer membrane lipoprotein-sorting protein
MNRDERQFEELIKKANLDDKPDYRHRDKLQQQLLAAFARHQWQNEQSRQTPWGQVGVWRTIMKSRITKYAAVAAVLAIAGIVSFQLITGTQAYAQVVEVIKKARTVVFTQLTQDNQGNSETIKTDFAYKESGHLRTSTVDGYVCVVDFTSGKMISIVPKLGYTLADLNSLQKSGSSGPLNSIEAMKNLPDKADEKLGAREIDDIDCDGYRVTQGDLTTNVWIDAKTGDLVQVEQKYASAPGMNRIIKNIKFDVELDDSLFSLTPPAGLKAHNKSELTSDGTGETEETFVNWLRWWAGANIDETFPPVVSGPQIAKITMDMGRQGKLKGELWNNADPQLMFKALLFTSKLPKDSNWRYAGDGVKINTPDTPIFWYKPVGSEKYRVIYANLTVKELSADQLPK